MSFTPGKPSNVAKQTNNESDNSHSDPVVNDKERTEEGDQVIESERRSILDKMKDSLRSKLGRNKKEDPNIYPLY